MIIWDYVKGLNADGNSYTFIKFPEITKDAENNYITTGAYKITPNIYTTCDKNEPYQKENSTATRINFGKILTSYDYIELEAQQNNNLEIYLKNFNAQKDPEFFKITNETRGSATTPFQIQLDTNQIDMVGPLVVSNYMQSKTVYKIQNKDVTTTTNINKLKDGDIYGIDTTGMIFSTKSIKTSDKCEALYFNATSDERAKENFIYVPRAHALEWINNLNIYTFNYRDNGKSSIGITTQQVQYKPVNNFNFVDNTEATGENGDYMTIKESKLVYMCMSAIQELSQQNQILQHQVNMLQDEINMLQSQK